MNPEASTRKTRSDCVLKNLPAEKRYAIADFAATNSIAKTRDWIAEHHKINTGRTAVGNFLSWMKIIDQRYENKGAVEGLLTKIETDAPELSPEELQARAKQHFAETVIHDSNVSAFNQSERNAIRREELEIQRQELAVEREQLELKREIFQRSHCQSIINACNDPKVIAVAENDELSYAEKVAQADKIMFGSNESKN
jgi:hypothetical protein